MTTLFFERTLEIIFLGQIFTKSFLHFKNLKIGVNFYSRFLTCMMP